MGFDSLHIQDFEVAEQKDAAELYELQLRAFESEAEMIGSRNVPALMETYDENLRDFRNWTVLIVRNENHEIIGAVRYMEGNDHIEIGRLMVAPEYRNQGIASQLLTAVERRTQANVFELYTCTKSHINIRLYEKLGYKKYLEKQGDQELSFAYMRKVLDQSPQDDRIEFTLTVTDTDTWDELFAQTFTYRP